MKYKAGDKFIIEIETHYNHSGEKNSARPLNDNDGANVSELYRKTENSSEKPNNCEDKPQTCDDCIWTVCNYNKAFEDEPQMGDAKPIPLSNRVTHIKDEPQTELVNDSPILVKDLVDDEFNPYDEECMRCKHLKYHCEFVPTYCKFEPKDEPQTDCDHKCIQTEIGCEKTDCAWK